MFDLFGPDTSAMMMPLALMMLALGGAALAWPLVTQERGRNDLKRRLRVEPDAAEVVEEAPRAVRQRGNQAMGAATPVTALVTLTDEVTNGLAYNFTFDFEKAGKTTVAVPIAAGEPTKS